MVASDFKAKLQQFQDTLNKEYASGSWAYPQDGNTYALLFPSPEVDEIGLAYQVRDYYRSAKNPNRKFLVRALILSKDGKYETDDDGNVSIVALVLGVRAMNAVMTNSVEFDAEWSEFENGSVKRGTTFVINKSGSQKTTTYTINLLPEKQESNYPLPETVNDPIAENENGLVTVGEQYNEWALNRVNGTTTTGDDGVDM